MILGDICTRNCKFCGVEKSNTQLLDFDLDEPGRIAGVVGKLGLKYVVLTSVTRDDLEDGGASIFARTIELIHGLDKGIKVEVLIPDFKGRIDSVKRVLDAHPQVTAHNIETVKRLYAEIRPKANYELSLGVLREIKGVSLAAITKSSLMLGLGEREEEVKLTMRDLRGADCDIITLGQYLAPSQNHYPVQEFISPEKFRYYKQMGIALGFKAVLSGPLVRSSYRAEEVYKACMTSL
jgi:lipoic acid synthetase